MSKKLRETIGDHESLIFELSTKLKAWGYLIRNQKMDHTPALDMEEIHWVIGEKIGAVAEKLRELIR